MVTTRLVETVALAIDRPTAEWQKDLPGKQLHPRAASLRNGERLQIGMVGEIIRYGGRHHLGMPGRHYRNPHTESGRDGPGGRL
jgi:hypothetical protein